MLESFNTNSEMQYQRLSEQEMASRGILGRLVGVIADFKNPTRNGRRYTQELWEKTFDDPIVKEKLVNRCILGELGHPADRMETDIEKVAICLAEFPKKGTDGNLHGVFDILNTPNGRILKTLCDYGCNIGVSSRGGGDTTEDYDGNETVLPDTYEFECFDAVILPAVKAARPKYVTESLDTKKTLKRALMEAMEKSSEEDRAVMKTTLDELKIDYAEEQSEEAKPLKEMYFGGIYRDTEGKKHKIIFEFEGSFEEAEEHLDSVIPVPYDRAVLFGSMPLKLAQEDGFELIEEVDSPEKVEDILVAAEVEEAENSGDEILAELQESLKRQKELEGKVCELQEKVSVCYTKESRYSDRLTKANSLLKTQEAENNKLSEELEALRQQTSNLSSEVSSLTEALATKDVEIQNLTVSLNGYRERFSTMKTKLEESVSTRTTLTEDFTKKESELTKLTEAYNSLKASSEKKLQESLAKQKSLEASNKELNEELQELRKDSQILKSQNAAKLEKSEQLTERYKNIAKTAVDKYIQSQATKIGVSFSDIKSRLNESYSFNDIDRVVEDLQQYKLTLNSLPFTTIGSKKPVKMKITESKESLLSLKDNSAFNADDDIDAALLTFTN